jgi:hypothetical protein
MRNEKTILKSEAVFSDDRKHRLLLRKEWDKDKKSAMVIMINPNTADTFNMDMTTMLVLNNLYQFDFGSVNIVNLYTRIMPKLSLRFLSDEDLIDEEADKVLRQYAKMSDVIIIAWGSVGNNSQRVRDRQAEILAMLSAQKDRVYQIGLQGCHPLTPTVRHSWTLELYQWEEHENDENNKS